MIDGRVIKTLDINGVKAEIQEFMDLKFLVAYGFNDDIERVAEEEKVDLIKVKGEKQPARTYFYKPLKIGYYKKLPRLIEEIPLEKEKRKRVRRLTELGITVEVEKPIRRDTFKEWLKVYEEMIKEKKKWLGRIGMRWFKKFQEKTIGLFAYMDNERVGGIIIMIKKENEEEVASSAFKAVKEGYVKEGIHDFLMYQFLIWAIKQGFTTVKAGTDPNFYGHHLQAGLFLFRKEWGFVPKPANNYEWIKFLNLEKFDEVCFFISGKDKPEGNIILKKEIENEKQFVINNYGFRKFMVVDNSLIERNV